MKLFGKFRKSDNPNKPKDVLVPPELQQYYQVEQTTASSGNRKKSFLIIGGVVLAAVLVTGVVLLVMKFTGKSSPADKVQINVSNSAVQLPKATPEKTPGFDKSNTQAVTIPAAL